MIKITLNGEEKILATSKTIADLLAELKLDERKIAIEQNYEIINNDSFSKTPISNGDQIEIVHFIGGG